MEGVNGARLRELRDRRGTIEKGGGARKLEAIRATGRGTARERIGMLLDEGSFIELDAFVTHRTTDHNMHLHPSAGDGVVAGHGSIDGRRVYCFAQDFSVHGGSMGEMHALKIAKVVEMAERAERPWWHLGRWRTARPDGIAALAARGNCWTAWCSAAVASRC